MGKGDRRTMRGKIWRGTTGKFRVKPGPGPKGHPEPVPKAGEKKPQPGKSK